MPSTPLVSIITPSYNQAAYLEQTLRSVLEQGYANLEYMVVDGGSQDGSQGIIQEYAPRLAWWVAEKDRGQADAINKGFARASGEIIAWLNSDDLYLPGAIQTAVQAFQEHPEAVLVFSDVRSIDENGKTFNIMRYRDWQLEDLMAFNIIGQPGVFMRRAALEQAGYLDLSYHFLLDHHLWLRVAQAGHMQHIPGEWSAARFHAAAKNVAQASRFGEEAYRLVDWMQQQPGLAGKFQRNHRRITAAAHRFNARYLLDGGQPGAALRAYWKSFLGQPLPVIKEAHRVAYAGASMVFNVEGLKKAYLARREKSINKKTQGLEK